MRRLLPCSWHLLLLLATAACGDDSGAAEGPSTDVDIGDRACTSSGAFGSEPRSRFDKPVKVSKVHTQVISKGDGNPVEANKKALLNIYIAKGTTGKKAATAATTRARPPSATMTRTSSSRSIIDGARSASRSGSPGRDRRHRQGRVGRRGRSAAEAEAHRHRAVRHRRPLGRAQRTSSTARRARPSPRRPTLPGRQGERRQGHRPRLLQGPQEGPDRSSRSSRWSRATARPPRPATGHVQLLRRRVGPKASRSTPPSAAAQPAPFGVGVKGLIPAWDKVIPGLKRGQPAC